ncbi:hypothetical protein [Actinoplanes sp. NPDC049118]|uniref:hypothetical protein n=1 Tax=Actinoplanes sp. NPDC049118 TaxID=3155769 RepID=UPI0034098EA1
MNEEEYGRLLLRPLDAEPDTPSRVDFAKAVRDGRRGRRWRVWSVGAGVTAVIAAATAGGVLAAGPTGDKAMPMPAPTPVPSSSFQVDPPLTPSTPPVPSGYAKPPGPVMRPEPTGSSGLALPRDPALPSSCTAEGLPTRKARSSDVTGGDPTGRYLVGRTEPVAGGEMDVLVWRDGDLIDRIKQSGAPATMSDINGSGLAVGGTDGYAPRPYFYRDGQVRRLPGGGRAVAVNEAGTIAGEYEFAARSRPQRWSSTTAEPELMPLIDGATDGEALDMNEDGTILVTLRSVVMADQTYLWFADGSIQKVSSPTADPAKRQWFEPRGFHYGWIYGEMVFSSPTGDSSDRQVYRYEPASGTWQTVDDPTGTGQLPGFGFAHSQASIIIGRTAHVLPRPSAKWGVVLNVVSEDGRIVAGVSDSQATIWRCE